MQRFNFDDADDYNENNFGSALLLFSNVSSQLILLSIISRILTVFNCGDNLYTIQLPRVYIILSMLFRSEAN